MIQCLRIRKGGLFMIDPRNSGSSISAEEMIEIGKNIELIPKEKAIAFLDELLNSDEAEENR